METAINNPQTLEKVEKDPYEILYDDEGLNLEELIVPGKVEERKGTDSSTGKEFSTYTIPLHRIYNGKNTTFVWEGPVVKCSDGIQKTTSKFDNKETYQMKITLSPQEETDKKLIAFIDAIQRRCGAIVGKHRVDVKMADFDEDMLYITGMKNLLYYPVNQQTGKRDTTKSASMYIDLFRRPITKGPRKGNIWTTLVKGADGKPIDWYNTLIGVGMECVPCFRVEKIQISAKKIVVKMAIDSLVIKGWLERTFKEKQTRTIQKFAEDKEIQERFNAGFAKILTIKDNALVTDLVNSQPTGNANEQIKDFIS